MSVSLSASISALAFKILTGIPVVDLPSFIFGILVRMLPLKKGLKKYLLLKHLVWLWEYKEVNETYVKFFSQGRQDCILQLNKHYYYPYPLTLLLMKWNADSRSLQLHALMLLVFHFLSTGCLPNFWHIIPRLFADFFLVFPDSRSTFYKLFAWYLSSQNQKFLKCIEILILFLQFAVIKKRFLDFTKIPRLFADFSLNSLTFQGIKWILWLFPDFSLTWQTPWSKTYLR